MIKICPQCDVEFVTVQAKFCSKDCYTKSQKGTDLLLNNRYKGVPWNKGRKFPSKANLVTKICNCCKSTYKVRPYRKEIAKYCSDKCARIMRNEHKSPINKVIRRSKKYKIWRESIFKRDGYTCLHCGIRGTELNADHILPFSLYPEFRFDVNNGRTLCVPCHRKTPTYGTRLLKGCVSSAQEA